MTQLRGLLIGLLVLSGPRFVQAYPHLIRHGYTHCSTCHVSPRGGSVMTDYGRVLSKEILSAWGYEGEQEWHYGQLNNEALVDWINVGGDFRGLQSHLDNSRITRGRFITMQEQVSLAAGLKNFRAVVTAGSDTLKKGRPWFIPESYLLWQALDKLSVRAGLFVPRFGINMPDHILSTRGPLGFGIQAERPSVEVTWVDEVWDASLTATGGELRSGERADAVYAQANYSFWGRDKIGFSLEQRQTGDERRSIGVHGMMGLSEQVYLLTDSVFAERRSTATVQGVTGGFFHFTQLGYEFSRGFHLLGLFDLRKRDLSLARSTERSYGAGFIFYPRPHWEFQVMWTKQRNLSISEEESDFAWLMVHYYL